MSLKRLVYKEFLGEQRSWGLDECDFTGINLVVAKNSTGKSRLINVIHGLCRILSGKHTNPFESGTYEADFLIANSKYTFEIEFRNGHVLREHLEVDGKKRLSRDSDGRGSIYYATEDRFLEFQTPTTVIAIQQKQDELQHPFVNSLSAWARGCQAYFFGTSLGRERLTNLAGFHQALISASDPTTDTSDLIKAYTVGYATYKEAFDLAILEDMGHLGYELSDVGSDDVRKLIPLENDFEPLIGIFVVEKDRGVRLPQLEMSQGMYRALALVIHINLAVFSGQKTLVLVDDIGEGLDFERSSKLIDLLIKHAIGNGIQLVMTTNDRFVMNKVPLEYWMLLKRRADQVSAITERRNPELFEEFKFMGLSNFDFFASEQFH